MSGGGTSVAGEYDYSGKNAGKTPKDPERAKLIEEGRDHRRKQVHAIFERLRQAVRNEDQRKAILESPGGHRLVALANAFQAWIDAGMPKINPDNPGAATMLVEKLYLFLRAFQG
jgi:hypothetical protein